MCERKWLKLCEARLNGTLRLVEKRRADEAERILEVERTLRLEEKRRADEAERQAEELRRRLRRLTHHDDTII